MCDLMLSGKGKVINRPTKTRKKTYDKFFIYISTDVVKDSAFPFKDGDEVEVKINSDNTLTIIKTERYEKPL